MHIHHQIPSSALTPVNVPYTQRAIAARSAAVTRKRLAFYASIWQLDDAASEGSHGQSRQPHHQPGGEPDERSGSGAFSVTV